MSIQESDQEIGRLLRELSQRKHQLSAVESRIKRIGSMFQHASIAMLSSTDRKPARSPVAALAHETDLNAVLSLLDEEQALREQIKQDRALLKECGIEV